MILSFVLFMILFLGGIWLFGIAQSLPENIAPGVLYMVSDLSAEHSGKILGVSSRGVREIKMLETEGFTPGRPYTAEELAANAGKVFFDVPADKHRLTQAVVA